MLGRLLTLTAAVLLLVGNLSGDDKKKNAEPDMEGMMKHATPGDAHKVFDHFVGKWTYKMKFWMDPKGEPMEMAGTSEGKLLMDGRFYSEHVKSAEGGMPFEGKAWQGYCNHKKKYWYSWIDSMTTSLTTGEGTWDAKTKTLTWNSDMFNAMTGSMEKSKEVTTVNADGTIMKTFYKLEGGKEIKTMELKLTKAK